MKTLIIANTMISVSHSQNKDIFNALKLKTPQKLDFPIYLSGCFLIAKLGKKSKLHRSISTYYIVEVPYYMFYCLFGNIHVLFQIYRL